MVWKRLGAALALLTLCGCLELEIGVELKADGSGSQTLHLGMTDRVIRAVEASARALDASGTREDPLQVFDAKKVRKELEDQGLAVTEHRAYRERRRRFVDVTAEFKDFATLQGSTLFGATGEWFLLKGRNPGNARLVYYPRGHAAWKSARDAARALATPSQTEQHLFESRIQQISGLDVALELTLPGDVAYASSNLEKKGKRSVVCRLQASDIRTPAELKTALAPRYEVEFSAVGCKLRYDAKDPGVTPPPEKK